MTWKLNFEFFYFFLSPQFSYSQSFGFRTLEDSSFFSPCWNNQPGWCLAYLKSSSRSTNRFSLNLNHLNQLFSFLNVYDNYLQRIFFITSLFGKIVLKSYLNLLTHEILIIKWHKTPIEFKWKASIVPVRVLYFRFVC